jgi:hypothetical protein
MDFCPEETHYRLSFTDLKGEEGSGAPEIVMRRMSIGEAIAFDELREYQPETDPQAREKIRKLAGKVADGLVSWNLVYRDGTPRPRTVEGVLSLDEQVLRTVLNAWIDAARGIAVPLEPGSTPGEPIAEPSIPMEALSPNLENWPAPVGS